MVTAVTVSLTPLFLFLLDGRRKLE